MDKIDSKSVGIAAGALALGSAALYFIKGKTPLSARQRRPDEIEIKGDFAPGERFRKTLEVQR